MKKIQAGDQVRRADSDLGEVGKVEHTAGRWVDVVWSGGEFGTYTFDELRLEPAPFKRGDKVEHINNAPGYIGVIVSGPYTSGQAQVEWPNGKTYAEQLAHLKHAEPLPTIQTPSVDIGSDWTKVDDVVSAPSHYRAHPSGIETITITKHESFLRGNVLKYVLRAPYKNNELEDMRKAQQYLAWEIERLEGENND